MYTRVVNFTGATDIAAGVSFLQDKVLPAMRDQQGYRGLIASADRAGGVFGVLSLWDTAEDREASDSMLAPTRQEAAEVIGGEMKVEKYEQLVAEVGQEPPGPGSALMVMRISMDPAKVDDNTAFFKSDVAPRISASEGFRGLRNMMNRATGEGIVGTSWSDQEALQRAAADAQARRDEATARGVTFVETSTREIVLVDLR
jgi:heme-degrading monooxygenase HmoA